MKKVTNYDKNGKIIKDLSKVKLPIELQKRIFKILNPGREIVEDDEKDEKE